ncbi:MAG: ABC transporter permease subunit, partial [Bacillota bacterium]
PLQIMSKVLLPEAFPALILAMAVAIVNLIGFSATAGVVGGGGLGDFAIRFGYQNFKTDIMVVTVLLLSAMVQGVQLLGERVAAKFRH